MGHVGSKWCLWVPLGGQEGSKVAEKRHWLKAQVDQAVIDQLQAISVSSPNGRLKQTAMLRKAVEEFIAARIGAPEVQQALATIRGQPLRLVPPTTKVQADSKGVS